MNVYDFDGTIYDGESCLDLFFWFVKKDKSLIKHIPKVLFGFAKYKMGKVTIEGALEEYAPYVENYFRVYPEKFTDMSEFWDKHIGKIKPFYKEIQKEDDLILTASPEMSMKEICARLGVNKYIGTVIEPETGKITRFNLKTNKVKSFFANYPDETVDAFYTDSPKNDYPIIEIAKEAYVVKGNKITKIK